MILTQGIKFFPPTPRVKGQASKPFPISPSSTGLSSLLPFASLALNTLANVQKELSKKPAREEEKVQTITDGRLANLI